MDVLLQWYARATSKESVRFWLFHSDFWICNYSEHCITLNSKFGYIFRDIILMVVAHAISNTCETVLVKRETIFSFVYH